MAVLLTAVKASSSSSLAMFLRADRGGAGSRSESANCGGDQANINADIRFLSSIFTDRNHIETARSASSAPPRIRRDSVENASAVTEETSILVHVPIKYRNIPVRMIFSSLVSCLHFPQKRILSCPQFLVATCRSAIMSRSDSSISKIILMNTD